METRTGIYYLPSNNKIQFHLKNHGKIQHYNIRASKREKASNVYEKLRGISLDLDKFVLSCNLDYSKIYNYHKRKDN